jgi:hypothetical protein
MKYLYDINLVSYLLLNGLEYKEVKINKTTNKIQFLFERSVLLDDLIEKYKTSNYKEFANQQNFVRRIIHTYKK